MHNKVSCRIIRDNVNMNFITDNNYSIQLYHCHKTDLDLLKAQIEPREVINWATFRTRYKSGYTEKEAPKKPGTKWTEQNKGEIVNEVWWKLC